MTKMDKLGTEPGAARDELAALQPIELHPVTARLGTAEDGTRRVTPASSIPGRAHGAYASGSGGSGGLPRIRSDAFSAIISTQALMWAETRSGMTEASTTRRCSAPRTRSSASVTVSGPMPMAQVPQG